MLIPALSKGWASPALPKVLINSPGDGAGASGGFTSSISLSEVDADVSSPLAFVTNGNIIRTARIVPNNLFLILFPVQSIILMFPLIRGSSQC